MRAVQLNERSIPATKHWNQDIEEFVRQLTSPKEGSISKRPSIDKEHTNNMRVISTDLSADLTKKNSVVSPKGMRKSSQKTYRCGMEEKDCSKTLDSCEIDEGVCLSVESVSSSSGLKDTRVTFSCEASPDTSDLDISSTTQNGSTKKDKESKRRRFKKIITRPLRRSKSDCTEKDLAANASFLDSDSGKENDTMENRAHDLSLLQERLLGNTKGAEESEQRKLHKTCSADAALMNSVEFMNSSTHQKSKTRSQTFKKIKRRFQFLRRRNTDTSLVPKCSLSRQFSLPTHEQALQWSTSFESLLNNKSGLELFKGFLTSEFSEENLEFWIACEEFRCASASNMPDIGHKIYGDFVASQAPKQVNLDSNTRSATYSNIDNPSKDTFQLAQYKIQALMEKDSYPRFIESDIYQQLLENISKA